MKLSTPSPTRSRRHRVALLFTAFLTTTMLFSIPAQSFSCRGEYLEMVTPVASVVEGPGDVAQEQSRWSALSPIIEGDELYFDDQWFYLEKVE